jgi:hypothetical protein
VRSLAVATAILHESEADLDAIRGQRIAVVAS